MHAFGAKPPPVQPSQGRSGKFRTRFSPVTTGAAGQSSGSRSPKAAQAAARRQRPALARGHGNLPRHIAMRVLRALADHAVSRVTPDLLLLAVQKPIRRRQVATLAAVPSRWCTRPRGSVPMCSFTPKCHRFPFFVWCISGSRALLSFPVDDGAEMMVAPTMVPFFSTPPPLGQVIPDIPNGWCASPWRSSRWRKSGSSSRPEPSQAPPRQSAGCSPPRKPVLHRRVNRVAERLQCTRSITDDGYGCRPCRRPSDTSAQCGPPAAPRGSGRPSAPERSRGASCDRIRGWQRSIAEGAACQRRGARQRARTECAMQRPKPGCIQRFPSHLELKLRA